MDALFINDIVRTGWHVMMYPEDLQDGFGVEDCAPLDAPGFIAGGATKKGSDGKSYSAIDSSRFLAMFK